MPKKKAGMTPEEQREAFRAKVREMVAAGELNPIEADATLDRLVSRQAGKSVKTRTNPQKNVENGEKT
jgi:hypothetical protein